MHHAGMLRSDRNLMEKAFADGMLKVCDSSPLSGFSMHLLFLQPLCLMFEDYWKLLMDVPLSD